MEYRETYESWLSNPYFDEETKDELRAIADDDKEIKERFYKDLEFGTAGLRGVIGAGTNRMNIYVVRKTTQGLANYIAAVNAQEKGVAIAYDSRRMSPEFAKEAALCLAANGIRAYIFESLRPTPELSYAVRKLGCVAGINITASHNPPEYNGYKVYWEDGAQITPPHDSGIMAEVQKVTDYNDVKTMDQAEAEKAGLYVVIGKEIDDAYMEELKSQVIHMDAIKAMAKELKIVYSPLHGTGNMSGCLLEEYELSQRKAVQGSLPEDGAVISTIVTTNMAATIAKAYGLRFIEVLTGFKFIGQQILGFEKSGKGTYLFGFEESYGCLIGTHARDKDAIVATMALCEAAAYYKTQGKTLWDAMIDMYEKYGYYKDDIQSVTLKGIEGLAKIQEILETFRTNPPKKIGAYDVVSARDYKKDTIVDLATGETRSTGLPSSNVLYYDLTDDAWVCVRPSGTEPKVKFYYGVKGASLEDAEEKSAALGKEILSMIDKML